MKEYKEIIIEFGYNKTPKKIIDEIDEISSKLFNQGWYYEDFYLDKSIENIVIFFYREVILEENNGI